jgi:hypothetical protein
MPKIPIQEDDDVILVEFEETGLRSVSNNPTELAEKSKEAIEHAMKTVQRMAKEALKTIHEIPASERPTTFEFQFGIKLSTELGAVVAKAGAEAAIAVTMTWEHKVK